MSILSTSDFLAPLSKGSSKPAIMRPIGCIAILRSPLRSRYHWGLLTRQLSNHWFDRFNPEINDSEMSISSLQIMKTAHKLSSYLPVNSSLSSSNSRLHPTCYPNKSLLRQLLPSSLRSPPTSMDMGISCLLALETMSLNRMALGGRPTILLHLQRTALIVSWSTLFFSIERTSALFLWKSSLLVCFSPL